MSGHGHPGDGQVEAATARILRIAVAVCAVAVVGGAIVLWPDGGGGGTDPLGLDADPVDAQVTAVTEQPCLGDEASTCVEIAFELTGGEADGATGTFSTFGSGQFDAGDDIRVLPSTTASGEAMYAFYDFQRGTPLVALVLLFAAAVVALGRWRGLGALAGLGVSLAVIVGFALPALVGGGNAVAVALVTAGAIAIIALYLAHGIGPATDVALLSTFASLALTGALAWVFVELTQLTGFTDDATFTLQALGSGVDPRGILLAGIVIGSLGVLDDVTVTQVSAVGELRRSDPAAASGDVFRRALRIGRDHISSTVNTLFLAYAGATLPLLLLFSEIDEPVTSVATREIVATEVVRAIVGSIGLVASVPISTWLAVRVLAPSAPSAPPLAPTWLDDPPLET